MDLLLLIILVIITIMMFQKNFKKAKQYRKDKTYIEIYTEILKNEEGAYDKLVAYINSENDLCLKAKAKLIKLYEDLDKEDIDILKEIDANDFMQDIFFKDNNFIEERVILNSEVFIWLILILSKARKNSLIEVMKRVYDKTIKYEDKLCNYIEYDTFKATYDLLLEQEVNSIHFLKVLIGGEYVDYKYDKNLIGIYKKIAASLLAYIKEPLDEGDEILIKDFTETLIGSRFTKDLDIYDKYHKEEIQEAAD